MSRAAANLLYRRIRSSQKLAGLTQSEIARGARIHQSQVSRIMSGDFTRITSQSVIRLCEFARITTTVPEPLSSALHQSLRAVWDGTKAQEKALVKLLRAADALALAHAKTATAQKRRS